MTKKISLLFMLLALLGISGYLLSVKARSTRVPTAPSSTTTTASQPAEVIAPISIPGGTEIEVRLLQTLSTKSTRAGDRFSASVERPILVDGKEIVPYGAMATGIVTSVKESGRIKGRSYLSLRLQSIELKNGKKIELKTNSLSRLGKSNRNRNLALMGGGAGIGAGVGAIAAGGKGVAIGGPVGLGAGVATKALIKGHEVTLPAETLLRFRLNEPTDAIKL